MDAPPRIKFKAPRAYRPELDAGVPDIVARFFRLQSELISALEEADGIDLARARVGNPVAKWITLSLGQEFACTAAHERRHLLQAARIREKLLRREIMALA
jgi:hypothetical protein